MKTILVNFTNSFFVRNFLRTEALQIIRNTKDIRLICLTKASKIEYYRSEFPYAEIEFVPVPDVAQLWSERFFKFVEMASIHTRTSTMIAEYNFHTHGDGYLLKVFFLVAQRLCWSLGQWKWWRVCIRRLYWSMSSNIFKQYFDLYRPDLVFCPSLLYSDNLLAREAKKRDIPVVGMILSWDNFYSKSLLRVHPDRLFVHTEIIKRQAHMIGDYPTERIYVTGLPQYDRHVNKVGVVSRESFMKKIGGDAHKKLIVYAFSGKAGLSIDNDMVTLIAKAREDGKIPKNTEILVRPYPRYDFSSEHLLDIRNRYNILAENSMAHVGADKDNWEFDENSLELLTNTLYHADVIVTMYSTFFIEGALFNKPLIAIAFDGDVVYDYWNSARRFFDWEHLQDVKKHNGVSLVRNADQLCEMIVKGLQDPGLLAEGRRGIVKEQIHFEDGKSAKRLAEALVSLVHDNFTV